MLELILTLVLEDQATVWNIAETYFEATVYALLK